ncbi:hypothetical protein MKW98_020886 [Papaver atlanticum]|uniref:Uncharacterized protein n=1 Tax=Papaver atlanticum TaxID=357466 RepID=A0AAD4THK8_9MAGN|nr:hypothetical protein MKW98_020886 [Papaver atlanticum]
METFGVLNVKSKLKCPSQVGGSFLHHRFMVRFEVEDHTGSTVFDSEVQNFVRQTAAELIGATEDNAKSGVISGLSKILQQAVDFQITLNSFNMKRKTPTSLTVTRVNLFLRL